MSCPSCGAEQYLSMGPGLAQCQGVLIVPTGAHPSGAFGPPTQQVFCGTQYQVPQADAPFCQCGMQSVARCIRCGTAVCLRHRWFWADSILCSDDYEALATEQREADQAREQELVSELTDVLGRIAEPLEEYPHLGLSHMYHGANLVEGDACSEHGLPCHVDNVYTKGIFKKPIGAFGRMNVWILAKHGGIGKYVGVNSYGKAILSISDTTLTLQHTWRQGARLDSPEAIEMFSRDWDWSKSDVIMHFANVLKDLIDEPTGQPYLM